MARSIVSEPLNPHVGFNWVFLIELLICGILTVFFLFYFNRLFATVVSYGIRAYTWHTYRAYIDIQALQISLLGGRIFFKDIRYHGHNETILVHGGYITWQYWIRRVKEAEIHSDERPSHGGDGNRTPTTEGSRSGSRSRTADKAEKGGKQTQKRLPCRISIKVSGVEAFMYNRSPAYDGIIDAIQRKANDSAKPGGHHAEGSMSELGKNGSVTGSVNTNTEEGRHKNLKGHAPEDNVKPDGEEHAEPRKTKPDDPPSFLRLLPIHFDCSKGAIVVGNEHTTSIITAQFEKASGEFDAAPCRALDVYQQVFNFQFTHPVVHLKPNPDFKSHQLESAMHIKQEMDHSIPEKEESEKRARTKRQRRHWSSGFSSLSALFSKSTDSIHTHPASKSGMAAKIFGAQMEFPGQERWKGLTRYLDNSQNDAHGEWDGVEYGRSSLIADCPCINVSFYWDIPAPVPSDAENSVQFDPARPEDINGGIPPEYGMDIQVYGGIINYGPWADRQRVIFQSFFFPGAHVDAVAASPLNPGELRVLSIFKLFLSIENDTVLRIPVRESSKDWKWKGKAHTLTGHEKKATDKAHPKPRARKKPIRAKHRDKGTAGPNVRPFAWIDIKVAGNSTVNYVMDMVAGEQGYKNNLDVDIIGTEISSSVNHGLLWRSGTIGLDCDLSNPLSWNSLRKWIFNISCRDLELFLLRDHLFLITDLIADWGSGPPSRYFTFVPFQYLLNINLVDFKLYLNTNDSNIVNNPSDIDDNNFIILYGQRLYGDLTIPLDRFRPLQNEIHFNLRAQDMGLELCMPSKNSLNAFVRSTNVAQLGGLTLKGSHTYMSETSSMNTDRLYMDIQGSRLALELYGFVVHHFMKIKDNYFGDDLHFKTLEEFQELPTLSLAVDDTTPKDQSMKVSNDLDVILCISADQVNVLLPSNLYSSENSLRVDLPYASADLRFTNYYMDLMVDFSPLSISLGTSITSSGLPNDFSGQTEVFIASLTIYGHRLFGLPPAEPTYLCNWDFDVGKISGECTSDFIKQAVGAIRSFAFTFDDDENALPIAEPLVIHDSTFLRLKTQNVHVWLHIAKEAVLLSTGPINLDFNDLAGTNFSQRLKAYVPDLTLGAVNVRAHSRHRSRTGEKHVVGTHAFIHTTVSLNMLERKLDFTEEPLSSSFDQNDDDLPTFNDMPTKHLDESFHHTSLLISAEPGIRMYCTPEAVRCLSNFMELIHPARPEDMLDVFQIDVMMKILNNQKRREGKGTSIEFNIRIPFAHLRFGSDFTSHVESEIEVGKDQYDLILNQLNLVTRIKSLPGERGSLGISVTERALQIPNDGVAVQAEITDLLVWMLKGKDASVNLSFRAFEVATASRKIEYLASLIHRTILLVDDLGTRFEHIEAKQQLRLRYLAWFLTNSQEQIPDPAFLTRPSYALRAARDHLRNHDSWKIISRLRYIWLCLPESDKTKLLDQCSHSSIDCPQGAEDKVISSWDRWRTWDLAHVKKSLAMRTLYKSPTDEKGFSQASPLYLDIRSAMVKLIIDPGPKQSEAALRMLAINVAIIPPPRPTGLMLIGTETPKKSTIIQINTGDSSIRLSWEICELFEIMVKIFQDGKLQKGSNTSPKPKPVSTQLDDNVGEDHNFQLIYVTDKAEVSLDTVNLRSISRGRQFRLSVVGSDNRASGHGDTITVLLHLDQAVMELLSRSRLMLRSQFDYPSLYFARHEYRTGESMPDEIKIASASRMIELQVKEDILGFIEVIDSVLRDEVAYFYDQVTSIRQTLKKQTGSSQRTVAVAQLPIITVALLMDAYTIELALLQALTWSITGSSGRISVVPTLGQDVTLKVNYDLEGHTHRLYSSSIEGSNVISSLQLPPVNGRLTVTNTEKEIKIFASGIIETMHVQASEIQALISTINKPEISSVVHAIKEDLAVFKTHIEDIFPDVTQSPVAKTPPPSQDVVFGVQMTLSGLNILASAPGQSPDSPTANLAVKVACIQVKATNIGPYLEILALPEVVAHLQQINVEMSLTDSLSIRRCGNLTFGATFQATSQGESELGRRAYRVRSSELEVNIFADTASAVVDVVNHLQDKIKDLDLSKEKKYLRRLRHTKSRTSHRREKSETNTEVDSLSSGALFSSTYSLELLNIQISWVVGTSIPPYPRTESEDLVLSFRRIDLSTRRDDAARLAIEDMRLQMVPVSGNKKQRSPNSALLPEVVFNVAYSSTKETRKIAFQAAGKSLDLRLDSRFILPANVIERSIALAGKKFRASSATWNMTPTTSGAQRKNPFGNKRWASLLVDANFAGAVVHLSGNDAASPKDSRSQQKGRYSQFIGDSSTSSTALRAPGVALKVEYNDDGQDPSLNAELRVNGSNNTLYPTVVPLIIDISDSIKEVVRDTDESLDTEKSPGSQPKPAAKLPDEDNIITADPSTILGRTRLNLGLRICKQEFSLSCQPIARVAAIAKLEDIYVTVNSVKSQEHGHFFAASAAFEKLEATVQHVYSRESTFGFDVDSIVLSLMNSKHLSGTSGISAILKVNPMHLQVNARQLQDFLLFREIWIPPEIRQASKPPATNVSTEPQEYLIQRYQQVTAATAFPWNANVAIANVSVELDLGQAIGKTSLSISDLWASSKKSTDWEQNLCIGIKKVAIESSGRTSGFVELAGVRVRTSISWPSQATSIRQTPLVQASLGFQQLRAKAGFDYQAFMVADIANFNFLMYNVHEQSKDSRDRLVAILDGDKVHVFCTATSAAQGLALWQAIERLVQENQQAYKQSLKDIEKFLRRKSSVATPFGRSASQSMIARKPDGDSFKTPISLHTDVVVTLRSINVGVFPSTFTDSQIFMLEASDVQARFAVALEQSKIHSGLGMTLGQLSVALSPIPNPKKTKPVSDLTVEDVAESARSARGGTILRVPKVIATMHTWQVPENNHIDYIFKSSLEGKVDVGWNYNRISYIRTMWGNHSRSLASRLGKPLPESAVKITSSGTPANPSTEALVATNTNRDHDQNQNQEKITAVVNVPQSKYNYTPLEPPLIETPQLRDMGEATPPLEWIGLHRDRLPNVTHQIVIVTLLEVAREVEDAYARILGRS
ncbi:uncharacterized protein BDR25DRAFT_366110 [Lindgomyces ingoldianus]|uniref:Uncharacterized protein n=1 Tax=Lindgomyces ingoldianus TaxID=673940 RepID=A0ACB6R1B0_9PLEO|nr:uncharacterized protein BDR25DRAFT_366110 [Lindgomyces ingoldianus]KAF2472875.1 hypothetical protein BDR25DRAFT_366110 [Lindgomyces ingoldianus]